MEELTMKVDLLGLIEKHIERTIDNFINSDNETYGYWVRDLRNVVQDKLAEKFVEKYSDEIFSNIAKDSTLTLLIREKVIADMAKNLHGNR